MRERARLHVVKDWDALAPLQDGPLYFYVGAGLSMAAGLIGWNEMASLIWRFRKEYERGRAGPRPPDTGPANSKYLQRFVNQKEKRGGPKILAHESGEPRGLGRTALLNMMLRYRAPRTDAGRDPPRVTARLRCGEEPRPEDLVLHSLIWRCNPHGVFTPNYDTFLEHAHSLYAHGSALRSYRYNADFLRYIMSNRRFVLKLHGDINDIGRMILDPEGAWNRRGALYGGRQSHGWDLRQVYATALERGHMVYVGFGFRDRTIRALHSEWRKTKRETSGGLRVAFVPKQELARIRAELEEDQRYDPALFRDVTFVPYDLRTQARMHATRDFLTHLAGLRRRAGSDWQPSSEATDIHRQVFMSLPPEKGVSWLRRRLETELWSCRAVARADAD